MSDVFVELGDGGGSWEVERQSLINGLGVGGVLDDTQHSGFLSGILYLRHTQHTCICVDALKVIDLFRSVDLASNRIPTVELSLVAFNRVTMRTVSDCAADLIPGL